LKQGLGSFLISGFHLRFGGWRGGGEQEHLSTDRLPLHIWAWLTGLSALTNDVIDGQNAEEHTKKHFCLGWCVSKWLLKVYFAARLITQ
jgi:hypothetical protein